MRLLYPDDEQLCLPISVGQGGSDSGPRLGGSSPHGVTPTLEGARYFATVPLTIDQTSEVSIFLAFDFDGMANASRRLLGTANGLLEVIVHERRVRAHSELFKSELSEHPLLIQSLAPDWFVAGGETLIESGHKIGGRPYLEHPPSSLVEELTRAFDSGFRQFLQMGFPSGVNDAIVSGDWPFADGVLHLLIRQKPGYPPEFRWFWDF